jgi:hypothetical protein
MIKWTNVVNLLVYKVVHLDTKDGLDLDNVKVK